MAHHCYLQSRGVYNVYNWTAEKSSEISCTLSEVFIHITEEGKMNSSLFTLQTKETMINQSLEMCLPLKKVTQIFLNLFNIPVMLFGLKGILK